MEVRTWRSARSQVFLAASELAGAALDGSLSAALLSDAPSDADCKIDLDKNLLRFEVYKMADNERVWSDTDCYASVQTGSQTFPAGKDVKFEAEWSRQASKPGECTDRPVAEPGAYFAHTVIGDNSSPPQDFTLR